MNRKNHLPTIVIFAILTVVTTFIWIGFEVYRSIDKDPSPTLPESATAALDPVLDTNVLSEVTQRLHLEDADIGETKLLETATPEPSPTPTPSPTPLETEGADASPNP